MKASKTFRLLRENGLSVTEAERLTKQICKQNDVRIKLTAARDWSRLLEPLNADIKNKQSNMARWRKDAQWAEKGPVYEPYLTVLLRTKQTIQKAYTLNLDNLTIPEIAAKRGLPGDGLHWSNWVPRKVHAAFMEAFDVLYAKIECRGKRIVPFSASMEQSASDVRWDKLIAWLAKELSARTTVTMEHTGRYDGDAILIDTLNEALDIAYTRGVDDVAPVNWVHLLPPERQKELADWRAATLNGLRDPDKLHAATEALHDATAAREKERTEKRRAAAGRAHHS